MIRTFLTVVVMLAGTESVFAESELIAYPTAEEPSFVITVPEEWEMEQAEDDGDFFHLSGPTGAIFSFRTIEGTEDSLGDAVEESIGAMAELFDDLELGDPEDWKPDGLTGFYAVGTGTDKEGGVAMKIGVGWCVLPDGKIAELWFVAEADDADGMSEAEEIANSLSAP